MYRSSCIVFLFLFQFLFCRAELFDFSAPKILVISNGDSESTIAADYFYFHLNKRNLDEDAFVVSRSDQQSLHSTGHKIYLEIVHDLKYDYEIVNQADQLSIFAKDKAISTWLSYMLIDHLSSFHNLEVSDLPPNYIDFTTAQVDIAFAYRDVHLMPNLDQVTSDLLLTHNVDRDWGIWGHNFRNVFANSLPSNSIALVNGKRDEDQFCFSATETIDAVRSYIAGTHGVDNRELLRFMIAPNDNDKVCTCSGCVKLGNTARNATPAVANLINILAKDFPMDYFYTIAYRSTKEAPHTRIAKNAGVFLTTIDLPKSPFLNSQDASVQQFSNLLYTWKQKTDNIYLWDYISNFDEYLVPFPMLLRVKEQLAYFKELGVDGFFMNGSGYDYSPFDDVKTYVLSALMVNPQLSVSKLVDQYHRRFYPITSSILSDYFMLLENKMYEENMDIYIYSSSRHAMNTYLDTTSFQSLYQDLLAIEDKLQGTEKYKIGKLITALNYVQLQSNYSNASIENGFFELENDKMKVSSKVDFFLSRLQKNTDYDILRYKEEKGDLNVYLKEWDNYRLRANLTNLLRSVQVKGQSSGDYLSEANLLYDNNRGFESDFHQGWFLAGESIIVTCQVDDWKKRKVNLQISFLINERHRMLAPESVEVLSKGKVLGRYSKKDFIQNKESVSLNRVIPYSNESDLEIRIYKNKEIENSVIACDEIQLY